MTFKEAVERTVSAMDSPTPPAEKVYDYIRQSYGFEGATVLLLSQDHVNIMVEGAIWCMNNPWNRVKFEELCKVGP